MVNKKNRSITIIAVIFVIAVACGYIFINGTYFQDFLEDSNLFQPVASPDEVLSATSGAETGSPGNITGSGKVSLGDAVNELYLLDSEGLINLDNTTFHEITGFDVDLDGFADNWIIGARKNGNNILFSFDSGGWNEMVWPGPLSKGALDLENNTSPEMLYSKNSDIIKKYYLEADVSDSDLIIDSEVCTIILDNGDTVTALKFKTDSGELI